MKTKHKREIQTVNLKNRAMIIVALMISILSALFFYNTIKYNRKEIENVTDIYHRLIEKFYNISMNHVPPFYRSALKRLLAVPGVKEAFAGNDRETLTLSTGRFLQSLGRRAFYLREINWYFPGDRQLQTLRIYASREYETHPSSINPLLELNPAVKIKKEYSGFFTGQNGITYRSIKPVYLKGNFIGTIEFIVSFNYFLDEIKKMPLLKSAVLIRSTDENRRRLKVPGNPMFERIGKDYYFCCNNAEDRHHLPAILKQVDMNASFTEVSHKNKNYLVRHHLELMDYLGNPVAKVASVQDITALKEKINHSIYLIITVTAAILLMVFLILYYSFGKLVGRLFERESQLEDANKGLETKIAERKTIEEELKRHRDHLEELIKEGTRELEIKSREIETNEKRLRTITSSLQDAIVMMTPEGNILFWNEAAEGILGYSAEEIQGKNFLTHIVAAKDHHKLIDSFKKPGKTAQKETQGTILEIQCKQKNGNIFPAELTISKVDIQGKYNVIALLRDITGKKEEETEKRILQRAVEQSSVGIEISDTGGIIQYVNPKFTEITGYEKEEVTGKNRNILKSDFNPEELYKDMWETVTSGKDWQGELHNKKKSGELYWELALMSPIKNPDGNVTHFVTIKEDITERKNMEAELVNAKESAEAASRSKGEFLANVSHEIRTPMNAIMGMTELTLGTSLDAEQREYLEIVQQASRSLLKLLNDILDFSRVDADKLILEPTVFSLRKRLSEITKSLAVQAHKKDLELVYYIDSRVPDQLIGDAGRLRQILVNLIGNSIKFTKEGEIVLKIEVLEDDLEGKVLVHIVVSDTGIGISQDQLGIIFDKFSQADSSTTREYGGTGLGLAISSKLIELMGGIIWAESPSTFPHFNKKGPGSTFHFTALFEICKESPDLGKLPEIDKLKNLPLLIVDDNKTNRKFLQEILSRHGLKPDVAGSGEEALEILQYKSESSFQLLILDFRMPGMDGGTLLKKIRRGLKSDVPVILLTSGVKIDDLAEIKAQGISAHLLKPVDSRELLETIVDVIVYKTSPKDETLLPVKEGNAREKKEDGPCLRVLVAEDNTVNQRLIKRLLEKEGHEVEIARDGKETFETFIKKAGNANEKFDLILMDIQMPLMDGIEATKEIRKIDKNIPIIALTAHAMKGDKEKFLSAGMDDYISKPVEKSTLLEVIRKNFK